MMEIRTCESVQNFIYLLGDQRSREVSVPEGTCDNSPTFSTLGTSGEKNQVPKGRLRSGRHLGFGANSAVLPGLVPVRTLVPTLKRLGYCHRSLRDKLQIQVALDPTPCFISAQS